MNTIHTKFSIKTLKEIAFSMHQGVNTVTESIQYKATGYPIIQSKHITKGFLDLIDTRLVGESDFQKYQEKYNPRIGDILICNIGTIGKSILIEKENNFIIAWNIFLVRLDNSQVYPNYCKHYLDDLSHKRYFDKFLTGGTVKFVSKGSLGNIEIPLPPIDQQKRIAAILDKAEELRRLRRQSIEHLDVLSRSIFIEMFGDPTINRKGWKKGCLGDVASFIGGGTPRRDCSEYFEGSICWATSKDMKSDFLENTQEHITSQAIKESSTNLVPIGTILIVIKSKILMHSLPLAITKVPICFNQDIKAITISQSCESIFVVMALRYGKKWLLDRARGANTEGLTLDHLKAFPLILPPLPLQQEFAQRIEAIEHLKSQHRESLIHLDTLFTSLQHRAFRGEL